MKLEYLNIINDYITAVYFEPDIGWQYTILLQDGNLFQPKDTFNSAEEAYKMAKNIIFLVIACDQENTALL